MKKIKITALLLAVLSVLMLCACNGGEGGGEGVTDIPEPANTVRAFDILSGENCTTAVEIKKGEYDTQNGALSFTCSLSFDKLCEALNESVTQEGGTLYICDKKDDFAVFYDRCYDGATVYFVLYKAEKGFVFAPSTARFSDGVTDVYIALPYHFFKGNLCTEPLALGSAYEAAVPESEFLNYYKQLGRYSVIEGENSFELFACTSSDESFTANFPVSLFFSESGGLYTVTVRQGHCDMPTVLADD